MQLRNRQPKSKGPNCSPGHLQKWMIAWTFVLVICLGAASFFALVQPPKSFSTPELAARHTSLAPYSVAKVLTDSKRSPASVASSLAGSFAASNAASLINQKDQALELDVNCSDYGPEVQKKDVEAKYSHVRLTGNACLSAKSASRKSKKRMEKEIVSSEIRNDSNGFTATVFYPKSNKFTTDYIGLRAGLNKIHVAHIYNDGEREEHEYILRRL